MLKTYFYAGEVCEWAEEEPTVAAISTAPQLAERKTAGRAEKPAGIVSQSEAVIPVRGG